MNQRKIDMDALQSILSDVTKPNQDHLVKEYQLAEHYDILLDHPTLLSSLDLPQQHRILSKALILNPEFPYSKFLDFISITVDKNPDFLTLLENIDMSNFDSQSLDKLMSKNSINPKLLNNQYDRLNDFINEQSQHMTNDLLDSLNEEIIKLKMINQKLTKEITELRTINDKLATANGKKDVKISKLIQQNNKLLANLAHEQQTQQRISEDGMTIKTSQKNSEQPNCDFYEVRQLFKQILSSLEKKENSYLEYLRKNENQQRQYVNEQNIQILNAFEIITQSLNSIQADNRMITQYQKESKEFDDKIQKQIQSQTKQFESINLTSQFDDLISSQAKLCLAIDEIKQLIEKPIDKYDPLITDFNKSIQNKIDESTKTLSNLLNQSQVESLSMPSVSSTMPVKVEEIVLSTSYLTFIQSEFNKITELASKQKQFIDHLNAELINSRKQIARYKEECTQFVYNIRDQYKEKLSSEKIKMSQQLQKEYQAKYDKALQEQKSKQQAQQLNDISIYFQAEVTNIMKSLKASLDYLIKHEKTIDAEEKRQRDDCILQLRNENRKLRQESHTKAVEKTQFESKLISILSKRQTDLSIIQGALDKETFEARSVYIATQIQEYMSVKALKNQIKQKDVEIETLKKRLEENFNANKMIQELQTILGISFSQTVFRDLWKNFRSQYENYECIKEPAPSAP